MTSLDTWANQMHHRAGALARRHPEHTEALARIAHDDPCPPLCSRCHLRHTGPCPCLVCHTVHRRACPTNDRPRPGCLVCQVVDDTTRALDLADLGDGMRSPSLDSLGGGGGPTSGVRPPPASPVRWWSTPAGVQDDDDESGTTNTPVEASALTPHPDRGALMRSADHRDEALRWLGTALKATTEGTA